MESDFASCLVFTQEEEGGYVADPRDSGNWTSGHVGQGLLVGSNMGIGAPALVAWMGPHETVTAQQMRDLRFPVFEDMARGNYWEPLGCETLPDGLDLMLFDFGWNRGIATSLNTLEQCLGIGGLDDQPMTSAVLADALQQIVTATLLRQLSSGGVRVLQRIMGIEDDGFAGPLTAAALVSAPGLRVTALILALSAAQVASYRLLGNFSIYGAGWLARSARRQMTAVFLAQQALKIDA